MTYQLLALLFILGSCYAYPTCEFESQPIYQYHMTGKNTTWECRNDGELKCDCPPGRTGPTCLDLIDYCVHPHHVVSEGELHTVPYCINGNCTYHEDRGSECVCNDCFTGKYCEQPVKNCKVARRCVSYHTTWTEKKLNDPSVIQYMCDLKLERCIPDDLNCIVNKPTGKVCDANGKCTFKCDMGTNNLGTTQKPTYNNPNDCVCHYPIGYCLALGDTHHVVEQAIKYAKSSLKVEDFMRALKLQS